MNKSLIAGIVFATATFGSSAVMAQTTPTATIGTTPQVLDLTDGSGFFGDTFAMNNNGATFADHFTFSVTGTTSIELRCHHLVDQPLGRHRPGYQRTVAVPRRRRHRHRRHPG
jgi:hypothetical protein